MHNRGQCVGILAAGMLFCYGHFGLAAAGTRSTVCLRDSEHAHVRSLPSRWSAVPIPLDSGYPKDNMVTADNLSATAYMLWDDDSLHVGVEVRDDTYVPGRRNILWDGDSLQLVLVPDPENISQARDPRRHELIFGLVDNEAVGIRRHTVAGLSAGEITNEDMAITITRMSWGMVYILHIPWDQLVGISPAADTAIAIGLAINDADSAKDAFQDTGSREIHHIQWTAGIFGSLDARSFGTAHLADSDNVEPYLSECTDLAMVSYPPAAVAAGDPVQIKATIPAIFSPYVQHCRMRVATTSGKPLGKVVVQPDEITDIGDAGTHAPKRFSGTWTCADAPDSTYHFIVDAIAGEVTHTLERTFIVRTQAVHNIRRLIDHARDHTAQTDITGRAYEIQRGYQVCLDQAQRQLSLGELVPAKDCAEQAVAWAQTQELPLELPPYDEPPTPGRILKNNTLELDDVTVGDKDSYWFVRHTQQEVRLYKDTFRVELLAAGQTWRTSQDEPVTATFRTTAGHKNVTCTQAARRVVRSCQSDGQAGIYVQLTGWPGVSGGSLELLVTFDTRRHEALLAVVPRDTDHSAVRLVTVNWPGPFRLDASEKGYWVFHCRSGCIVPADWPRNIDRLYPACGYNMGHPYPTVVRDHTALVQFIESHTDAEVRIRNFPDSHAQATVEWQPCWGVMRYPRQIRLAALDDAGYVEAAKWYRQLLIERGKFVTLEQRMERAPALKAMHGGITARAYVQRYHMVKDIPVHVRSPFALHADYIRQCAASGVPGGSLEMNFWWELGTGFSPDIRPADKAGGWDVFMEVHNACHENNWAFGYYDCYSTYYQVNDSYTEAHAQKNAQGLAPKIVYYPDGPYPVLAPAYHLHYLKMTMQAMKAHDCMPDVPYLDCFMGRPEEDYDPRHPATRYTCHKERLACCRYLHELGCVAKVENECYFGLEETDMPHWSPPPDFGVPVPLTHLVLHDSMFLQQQLRNFRYWGDPRLMQTRPAFIRCLMLGETPFMYIDYLPVPPQYYRGAKFIAAINKTIGTRELVNHRFLRDDYSIQETEFAGGIRIRGDFNAMTVTIHGLDGVQETPIDAMTYGYDFDVRVDSFKKIGDKAFEVALRWQSPDVPDSDFNGELRVFAGGKRLQDVAGAFSLHRSDWKDGVFTTKPLKVTLPRWYKGGPILLSTALNFADTGVITYFEGIVAGAATRDVGTVQGTRRAGGKFTFVFERPAAWPASDWIITEGPGSGAARH